MNKITLRLLIIAFLISTSLIAQNETCDTAIATPFDTIVEDTVQESLWYSFVAPTSGHIIIEFYDNTPSTSEVIGFGLYGDCNNTEGPGLAIDEITSSSNAPFNLALAFENLQSGETYYLVFARVLIISRSTNSQKETVMKTDPNFGFRLIDGGAVLSTNSFEEKNEITSFPNPIQDELTIKAKEKITNLNVFNMLGEKIFTQRPNTIITNVDFSAMASGMYLVNITSDLGTQQLKVIKK